MTPPPAKPLCPWPLAEWFISDGKTSSVQTGTAIYVFPLSEKEKEYREHALAFVGGSGDNYGFYIQNQYTAPAPNLATATLALFHDAHTTPSGLWGVLVNSKLNPHLTEHPSAVSVIVKAFALFPDSQLDLLMAGDVVRWVDAMRSLTAELANAGCPCVFRYHENHLALHRRPQD